MSGGPVFDAFMGAVYQARKRTDGTITREDAERLWERCGGKCEVSGLPFSLDRADQRYARRPWAPSIDQVEAGKGYGIENVRVVCIAVNYAMNHWGEEVLYRIAMGIMGTGRMAKVLDKTGHKMALPVDIRIYRGVKRVRYLARVRDPRLPEQHLGRFQTLEEALAAQVAWAVQHQSEKVLRQVYEYTRDDGLLEKIRNFAP